MHYIADMVSPLHLAGSLMIYVFRFYLEIA